MGLGNLRRQSPLPVRWVVAAPGVLGRFMPEVIVFALTVTLRGRIVGRAAFDQDVIRIGRTPDNDVFIDNAAFSRAHAVIRRRGIAHILEDLGTRNGSHVNGRCVQVCALNDGDRITVGKYTLIVSSDAPHLDVPAVDGTGGETLGFRAAAESHAALEASSSLKGFLLVGGAAGRACPLVRDTFVAGSASDSDLVLPGWFVPKKVALITRGFGGFSLISVAGDRHVRLNGRPVTWQAWLQEGDELVLAGTSASFVAQLPAPPVPSLV
jgi:hypothetical protein